MSTSPAARNAPPARAPRMRLLLVALLVICLALAVTTFLLLDRDGATGAVPSAAPSATPSATPGAEGAAVAAPSPTPSAAPTEARFTIGYAGDVLTHMPVMDDTAGGGGDIEPLIAAARPWSEGVDLALCGMEVPVSPDGVPSGYPVFGSTAAVVDALSRSGWDGCATASNHSWDQGFAGVVATADALRADSMGYSGTNRTQAEADAPYQLYELTRGGMTITVAQLSTTYDLNGFSADPDWAVNLNDVAWIEARARAARQAGADVVVLHAQIGEEYSPEPVPEQTEFARAVAQTGQVDVFFGAHPHVPETNELLPGGPGGRGMWVSYSAGNFISNQSEELGTILVSIGLFVWVDVVVTQEADGTRSAGVEALHWRPFTVDLNGGHRLVDLAAAQQGRVPEGSTLSAEEIDRRWRAVTEVVNPQTLAADAPPAPSGDAPAARPRG